MARMPAVHGTKHTNCTNHTNHYQNKQENAIVASKFELMPNWAYVK